ncbi:MAG: hypothetical protein H6893_04525 [Brucellaceae bacterium]|nr:hypothetical protein [Brucellaceae bacterium]
MDDKRKDSKLHLSAHPARGGKAAVEDAISRRLRDFYDSVADEPIPDRFLDLLEKLDQAEKVARSDGGAHDDDA